jgi:hypothetical protein
MNNPNDIGSMLDAMGQLTASGWELVMDRAPESPLMTWRLQLRKPKEKTLEVEGHSLGIALNQLVKKYERKTGLKARR